MYPEEVQYLGVNHHMTVYKLEVCQSCDIHFTLRLTHLGIGPPLVYVRTYSLVFTLYPVCETNMYLFIVKFS